MEIRPTILIVDDDIVMRSTLASILAKDYETVPVPSAKEALQFLESREPHAVLSDIKMPEMDGIEFLKRVKATYPFVPVILITSIDNKEMVLTALRAGAFDYLPKPIGARDLKFAVERAVKQRLLEFEREFLLRRLKKMQVK